MADIILEFGVLGGSSVTEAGSSGEQMYRDIEAITKRIEEDVTKKIKFEFDTSSIAQAKERLQKQVSDLKELQIPLVVQMDADQIQAAIQKAQKQGKNGRKPTNSGSNNADIKQIESEAKETAASVERAGEQMAQNTKKTVEAVSAAIQGELKNLNSVVSVTEKKINDRLTNVTLAYTDKEGTRTTQNIREDPAGNVITTITESNKALISDLARTEKQLQALKTQIDKTFQGKALDDFGQQLEKSARSKIQAIEQQVDRVKSVLKQSENSESGVNPPADFVNIDKTITDTRSWVNVLNEGHETILQIDRQFSQLSADDANASGQAEAYERQKQALAKIKQLQQEVLQGSTADGKPLSSNSVGDLSRKLHAATTNQNALNTAVKTYNTEAKKHQNATLQINKIFSEAHHYFNKYQSGIKSNVQLTERWWALLNKIESGGFGDDVLGARNELAQLQTDSKLAGAEVTSLHSKLGKLFKDHFGAQAATAVTGLILNALHNVYGYVVDIDAAMTELRKVTDETDTAYERFLSNTPLLAKNIGASISDFVNATADFARLGYNMSEATMLAEAATTYKNVGDGIDSINTASKSIISTMKAFGIAAEDSMQIVDKFNIVGNNFAISSVGIGEALERSAATLAEAGNSIEESIALVTAANTVIQDPDVVGTAMKTISMYLRAAKTDAEAAGIETDGMAESVSKLREELKSLTGVDIMLDNENFKSTYQILSEISEVWSDLSDVTQSNIMERLAGKRQGNVLASILNNWQDAEGAYRTALDSEGSALAENEKYLNSIAGCLQRLKVAYEDLSESILGDDLIKNVVGGLTNVIDALNTVSEWSGNSITGNIIGVGIGELLRQEGIGFLTTYKDQYGLSHVKTPLADLRQSFKYLRSEVQETNSGVISFFKSLFSVEAKMYSINKDAKGLTKLFNDVYDYVNKEKKDFFDYDVARSRLDELIAGVKGEKELADVYRQLSIDAKTFLLDQEQVNNLFALMQDKSIDASEGIELLFSSMRKGNAEASTFGAKLKSLGASLASTLLQGGISFLASWGISALVGVIDDLVHAEERAKEAAKEARAEIESIKSEFDSLSKSTDEVKNRFAVLAQGVENLGKLNQSRGKLTTDDYNEFLDLSNQLAELFPQLTRGYDENGNAILNLSGNVNTITASLENLVKVQSDLANQQILEKMPDVWKGYHLDLAAYEQSLKNAETGSKFLQEVLNGLQSESDKEFVIGNYWTHQNIMGAVRQIGLDPSALYKESRANFDKGTGVFQSATWDLSKLESEQIDQLKTAIGDSVRAYENSVQKAQSDISSANAGMSKYIYTWFSQDWNFLQLSAPMQNLIQEILLNSDWVADLPATVDTSSWDEVSRYLQMYLFQSIQNIKSGDLQRTLSEAMNNALNAEKMHELIAQLLADVADGGAGLSEDNPIVVYLQTRLDDRAGLEERVTNMLMLKYADAETHVKSAMQSRIAERVGTLSYDDLTIAAEQIEIPEDGLLSWAKLIGLIEKTKTTAESTNLSPEAFNISEAIEANAKSVKILNAAIDEMNDTGHISASTYADIVEAGGNFTDCLEIQNGQLVLNIQKLKELEAQEYKNAIAANNLRVIELRPLDWMPDINEQINKLFEQNKIYQYLIDDLNGASGTDKSTKAEDNGYDTVLKEYDDLLDRGLISYREYLDRKKRLIAESYGGDPEKQNELLLDVKYSTDWEKLYQEELDEWEKQNLDFNSFDSRNKDIEKRKSLAGAYFFGEGAKHQDVTVYKSVMQEIADNELALYKDQLDRGVISTRNFIDKLSEMWDSYVGETGDRILEPDFLTKNIDWGKLYDDALTEWERDNGFDGSDQKVKERAEFKIGLAGTLFYDESSFHHDVEKYREIAQSAAEDEMTALDAMLAKGLVSWDNYVAGLNDISARYTDSQGNPILDEESLNEKLAPDKEYETRLYDWDTKNGYDFRNEDRDIELRRKRAREMRRLNDEIFGLPESDSYDPKTWKDNLATISDYEDQTESIARDAMKRYIEEAEKNDERLQRLDKEIEALEDKNDALKKANELEEKELALAEAKQKLEDASRNRNQLVFKNGGFEYAIDQEAYQDASDAVKGAENDLAETQRQTQIELLTEERDGIKDVYDLLKEQLDDLGEDEPAQWDYKTADTLISRIDRSKLTGDQNAQLDVFLNQKLSYDLTHGTFAMTPEDIVRKLDAMPSIDHMFWFDGTIRSASEMAARHLTNNAYDNRSTTDQSIHVGDIHINVQGDSTEEMLNDFARQLGTALQTRLPQVLYRK